VSEEFTRIKLGPWRFILLGLALGVLLAVRVDSASAATLTVCPAGPPNCQYATIPAALAAAVSGDTITLASGTYIAGFTIDKGIRLIGSGQDTTSIVGGDPTAITISSGVTVLIRDVAITGAVQTGIENDGDLTVRAATIRDNNTTFVGRADAGGILNNGTLAVSGTTISGNWAYAGGGIANFGTATVTGSTLSHNMALFDAGAIDNSGSLVIRDSSVEDNEAQGAGAFGNGMYTGHGDTLIVNTRIVNNAGDSGAAIVNSGSGALTLKASTVTLNLGFFSAPAITNYSGSMVISNGSSIDHNSHRGISNSGAMTLDASSVTNNMPEGGIKNSGSLTLRGSTVQGNSSDHNGGGIANEGAQSSLLLISSTVSGNTAQHSGGGISNYLGTVALRSSVITQNTAVLGTSGCGFGGGIFNTLPGTVTFKQSSVSGNTPDDFGGC